MLRGAGLLLLTAVAGYWVLERAESHRGSLRRVGRFVAWAVILFSLVGVVCSAWCAATCPPGAWGKKGGWFCPMSKGAQMSPMSPDMDEDRP